MEHPLGGFIIHPPRGLMIRFEIQHLKPKRFQGLVNFDTSEHMNSMEGPTEHANSMMCSILWLLQNHICGT